MATITLTVIGSTVGAVEVTKTLSGTDSDRLMAYLVAHHGADQDGNPRTPNQIVGAYWDGINAGTIDNVTRWEREMALSAAQALLPAPIVVE